MVGIEGVERGGWVVVGVVATMVGLVPRRGGGEEWVECCKTRGIRKRVRPKHKKEIISDRKKQTGRKRKGKKSEDHVRGLSVGKS